MAPTHGDAAHPDGALVRRGLALVMFTIAWNAVEGVVGLWAAWVSGSVALLGFGADAVVETSSGFVAYWRLRVHTRHHAAGRIERTERRAQRLIAGSLFALALFVAYEAIRTLHQRDIPQPSVVGLVIAALSLGIMGFLARAKHKVGHGLRSRALEADAFQTTACFWLSLIVLVGIGLNYLLGWWWADPAAALVMVVPLVQEGRAAWMGEAHEGH